MKRLYEAVIEEHFSNNRQMLFLMGPRQVGKTTTSLTIKNHEKNAHYLSWDNANHQQAILKGPEHIAHLIGYDESRDHKPLVIFDEIHKYAHWKNFLKGFFDTYSGTHILVTGSSRLDIYKRGGDSLMGRYFPYHIHPLSVAELHNTSMQETDLRKNPTLPTREQYLQLYDFSGFPEPFTKQNRRFFLRWKDLRLQHLLREDLRDLTRIQELNLLGLLAQVLAAQAGQLTSYTVLAKKIGKPIETVKRWIETLKNFYHCFSVSPWSKNVTRALLKEPKYFLWNWAYLEEEGAKFENFIASHLYKAVHYWNDLGLGRYGLYFLRNKDQREVDFLVVKDDKPWIMVEAKLSKNAKLSPNLKFFQDQLHCEYVFQVVHDLEAQEKNPFTEDRPVIVSAQTLLAYMA